MKAEISQLAPHRERRFSGVYQQQGRMLVDRDWNELADVLRQLGSAVAAQAIGTGAPRRGGLLAKSGDGLALADGGGLVTAGGVIGEVRPRDPAAARKIYGNQLDLPGEVRATGAATQPLLEPNTTPDKKLLYVDVWERTVAPVEFADLIDPVLPRDGGAIRSQRVAQIKAAAAADLAQNAVPPAFDADRIPAKGNAQFTAVLTPPDRVREPCDPCAEPAAVARMLANGLFRLEVHSVGFAANRRPNRLVLKWSRDNGARELRAGEPGGRPDPAQRSYEYFSDATERLLGMPSDDWQAEDALRGVLDPDDAAALAGVLPRVREWDGWCELQLAGKAWRLGRRRHAGRDLGAAAAVKGGALTVRLDDLGLTFTLTLAGKSFLPGDYWLVLMRARAPKDERVRAITALPLGIEHRYCVLGIAALKDGGVSVAPLSAPDTRRLQHPSLTGVDAADVGYTPDDSAPALKGCDTVKKAIDVIAAFHPVPHPGVTAVTIAGAAWSADRDVHPADLARGIRIVFDQPPAAETSPDFPICTVSMLLPWPRGDADRAEWGTAVEPGFEPVALAGKLAKAADGNSVVWTPDPATVQALPARFGELHEQGKPLPVRACLRIGGQFVRAMGGGTAPDAELWFWLDPKAPPIRGWTKIVDDAKKFTRGRWVSAAADGETWVISDQGDAFRYLGPPGKFEPVAGPAEKLKQVSVADRLTVFAVGAAQPDGQNNKTYRYRAEPAWEEVPNAYFTQVSVAADGTAWAINQDRTRWRLKEYGQNWEMVDAAPFLQIAAGSRSEAWAIAAADNALSQYDGNTWQQVAGAPKAKDVSVAADGTVWCVRADDGAALRYLGPAGGWEQVPAPKLKQVAVASRSHAWALADDPDASIYRWDWAWQDPVWTRVMNGAKWIAAAADGAAWVVSTNNEIYRYVGRPDQKFEFVPGPAENLKQVSVADQSTALAVGATALPDGNSKTYRYRAGSGWETISNAEFTQVSVAADGTAWAINKDKTRWRLHEYGQPWVQDGNDKFLQIEAGSRSEAWAIDADNALWQYDGSTWQKVAGAPKANHVSVAADGTVWCVRFDDGAALRYRGPADGWEQMPAPTLKQVAVGSRSHVWGLGGDPDGSVYRWD
jgi:Tectonin domain